MTGESTTRTLPVAGRAQVRDGELLVDMLIESSFYLSM
jgi:hypothetical protein